MQDLVVNQAPFAAAPLSTGCFAPSAHSRIVRIRPPSRGGPADVPLIPPQTGTEAFGKPVDGVGG